ncbi:MAG: potassium channel family protein [Clostridia bacterium]
MKKKKSDEYVIIIGCGRLGTHLANLLSIDGYSVVVVDKEAKAFESLSENFGGFTIEADAIEDQVLREANIDRADVLAATTDDDNTNIMIAQIAKTIYNVPKVIARLHEPNRKRVYQQLDIETVSPTTLSAEEFQRLIIQEEDL